MDKKKKRRGFDIEKMSDAQWERLLDEVAGPRAETNKLAPDPRFTERQDEPTPSGGDYSIAYFYDVERRPCKRENAEYINIIEYKNDGTRINETYLVLGSMA